MRKILYVLAIYLAAGYGAERQAEISFRKIFTLDKVPEVSVSSGGGNTKITWNASIDADTNPLKAMFLISFKNLNESNHAELPNLCGTYKKGTLERRIQSFILKIFANVNACPIKNGTSTVVPTHLSYKYSTDNNKKCGPFASFVLLLRKNDTTNPNPLIVGEFAGNITGC